MYLRLLPNGITIRNTQSEDLEQLEELQIKVFPTLSDSQRLKVAHYSNHLRIFPEGQFVADYQSRIIGMTTTIRLSDKFLKKEHSFDDIIQGGYCNIHDPLGEWLYGIDMGTDPNYRGRGVARALYVARQELAKKLCLKGQYTVGMLNGFSSSNSSLEQYYLDVVAGIKQDTTVSAQIKIGFEANGLIKNYLDDPGCGNSGVILILPISKEIGDSDSFYR